MERVNVVIAGVGGQGNVVASEILATELAPAGYLLTRPPWNESWPSDSPTRCSS